MAKTKYRQCTLTRVDGPCTMKQVAWIPSRYAKLNKYVKLKQDDGSWLDSWLVRGVSEAEIDEPPDINKMIRGHRKNTGDSLK